MGKAYKEVATSVTVLNSSKGSFNRKDYVASDELIDDLMTLVYETLDISINRDIDLKQTGVRKVQA